MVRALERADDREPARRALLRAADERRALDRRDAHAGLAEREQQRVRRRLQRRRSGRTY
jgi:hypothetical protein